MEQCYARQELLSGWDQRRLTDATLVIAGSGPLAFLSGLMAAAMGFGRLGVWGRAEPNPTLVRLCTYQEFPLLSQVVAGLLIEEMRKALLPIAGEAGPTDQSNYLRLPAPQPSLRQGRLARTTARSLAMVGAGALGTWFGTEHSAMVACPDNFAARAYLNGLAKKHGRLLISGGTSATGGSCLVYEPGQTCCLSCRLRIDQLAEREAAPQSCAQQVQPSIATSNAMVGALMAWLLHERLSTGRAEAGMWEYDGRPQHTRLSLHSGWPACQCHRPARR